ncbi:GIY-YIG nuclease family protein [Pelagibius litoralis]|uniref:GIY-YIG nuclease family protein n=1 Tax=Pelagibius litoralis TaxID=374515 RepID=A0A967F3Y6_9PROT|nr:GIY-YIG nuclease family protein [Pelagibius litoralis]NIA72547.1 GIY-YIG nuclease family protein [Pelagibius litoralis]
MAYYVYILASQENGTLYIGMTNDLVRRIHEHRESLVDGFTKRHGVKSLVYFETHDRAAEAIQREKSMKRWRRDWKINQIERDNPHWEDLYDGLFG